MAQGNTTWTLLESVPGGVVVVGDEGEILFTNHALNQMLGYRSEELLGQKIEELVPIRHRGNHVGTRDNYLHSPVVRTMAGAKTLRARRKDGSELPVEISLSPTHEGYPKAIIAVLWEVSERQRIQEQLLLSERLVTVGTLAAGVAHEVNNPLSFVLGNLQCIQSDIERILETSTDNFSQDVVEQLSEIKSAAEEADEGARRVGDIVRALQTFARPKKSPHATSDLQEVLDGVIRLLNNEIRHRAQIIRKFDRVPPVQGEYSRLSQVCLNLILNAAQSIPDGDAQNNSITIQIYSDSDGRVVAEFKDTGDGISEDVLPRIFDPFFTTKLPGQGTGLGLPICHSLVQAMDGALRCESKPGEGATFILSLKPALAQPPIFEENEEDVKEVLPERLQILVVDDEPLIGRLMKRQFGDLHDVSVSNSAKDTLDRLNAGQRFDVIFCDVMMPIKSGAVLYEEVNAMDPQQAERFVFLTGGAFSSQATQFLAKTVQPCLEKPFDDKKIVKTLERFGPLNQPKKA